MLTRERFLDYDFIIAEKMESVIADIFDYRYDSKIDVLPIIFTPNVDYIVKLNDKKYEKIKRRLQTSAFTLPDGQPIIWASKMCGGNIRKRLPGSDLFSGLYSLVKTKKIVSLFLSPDGRVSDFFKKDFPDSYVITLPYINLEDNAAFAKVIDRSVEFILKNDVKFVFIGISFPKQDIIALGILDKLRSRNYQSIPTLAMIGASLEFEAKIKKRAPLYFQNIGLEWFYRFLMEPKRLFKRYFIESFQFINIVRSSKWG